MNPVKIIIAALFAIIGMTLIGGSFYVVNEGERGVLTRLGKVTGVAEPGLGFKTPFITGVNIISVRQQVKSFEGMQAYTSDQQVATVERVSITYSVPANQVREVYTIYGSANNMVIQLLDRRANKALENVFGSFTAAVSVRERKRLGAEYTKAVADVDGPLIVSAVNIESVSFPDEYEANINELMKNEVEVSKEKQLALKSVQTALKTVTEAKATADSNIATATAEATAIQLKGDAEAGAIRAKGAALRDNPALIGLISAERWDGVLPLTMVPGGAVPFIDVAKNK